MPLQLPGPPLDTPTLLFAISMVSFVMSGFTLSLIPAMPEQRASLRLWALANAVAGVAFGLYFLRGHIAFGPSFIGANVSVVAVPALFLRAQLSLLEVQRRPWLESGTVLLGLASVLPVLIEPGLGWIGALVISAGVALMALMVTHLMWTHPKARAIGSSRFIGLVSLAACIAMIWRASGTALRALDGLPYDIRTRATSHTASLLIGGLFLVGASVAYVSAIHELRRRELAERARRDGLSGVLTRGAFFDEAQRALRSHPEPLAVAMIDIDHFKRVNDGHGHAAGDQAIVHLARLISAQVRSGDLVGRYGGEEFIVLLHGASLDAALRFGQRLVEAVRVSPVRLANGTQLRCTLSVGVCECDHRQQPAEQALEQAIALADAALYLAKASGRDQVQGPMVAA